MKKLGVKFKEIDINESKQSFDKFKNLGGTAIPLTIKKEDGKIITRVTGFNKEKLSRELLLNNG